MPDQVILIVEDDPTLRMLTHRQLSKLCSCTIESVSSGEEAVKRDADDVALIFMDIGLPGIDGGHATLLIREKELNKKRKRTPIVALTGHADKERCMMAGMDDHLLKPALLDDLKRILDKFVPATLAGG